jgi:hypothetical protein
MKAAVYQEAHLDELLRMVRVWLMFLDLFRFARLSVNELSPKYIGRGFWSMAFNFSSYIVKQHDTQFLVSFPTFLSSP